MVTGKKCNSGIKAGWKCRMKALMGELSANSIDYSVND